MQIRCLGIELTDRCDLACSHCLRHVVPPRSPRARDLDVSFFRRLVTEAAELGVTRLGLTGGEPMLHPQFLEILDIIGQAKLPYHFLSNGLGLPGMLPRLVARPGARDMLKNVCISLDGATEETHDRIRGKGTFRRTLAGVAVTRALKIPFSLLMTVGRTNRHEIEKAALFAHHLGAERMWFTHFLPSGRMHATDDFDLSIPERLDVEAVIFRLQDALRFPIGMGEGHHSDKIDHMCATVSLLSLNIDASGHGTFCCELSSFNGDDRNPESRPDFVSDLHKISLKEAMILQTRAVERFRAERLARAQAGLRTADDEFPCRYCVRQFGKPERGIVPLRRRQAV
jgi:molybdenum cofactor biosynthesis enzyme MoaA